MYYLHSARRGKLFGTLLLLMGVVCTYTTTPRHAFAEPVTKSNPKLWQWTSDGSHLKSVVQVSVDGSQATGVVFRVDRKTPKKQGHASYVLTAFHVVERVKPADTIKIMHHDGTETVAKLVASDDAHDLAILKSWSPEQVKPAKISQTTVRHKMFLEFAGLGGGAELRKSMRHFSGKATQPTNGDFIYADQTLLPGDSGGPIFNSRRELVGIISGGWFWWDAGIVSTSGTPVLSTWPARASNLDAMRELIAKLEADELEQLPVEETDEPVERLAEK